MCVSVGVGGPTCVVWLSSVLGVGACICRCGWTYLCCLGELSTWCGCVYLGVGGPTCVVWVSSVLGVGVCICRCGCVYL